MPLDMEVGLSPGHIMLDRDLAPQRSTAHPQFSAHVCCGQTAGWIKISLGTVVDLGPGHVVLDGDGTAIPSSFRPMSVVAKRSPISATAEL